MLRLDKIRKSIADEGLDALYVSSEVNRRYVTGFHSTAGAAIITPDEAYFFTDSRYIEAASAKIKGYTVELCSAKHPYKDLINGVVKKHGVKKLGFEEGFTSYAEYLKNSEELEAELVPAQELITRLRELKDGDEIQTLIRAQRLAEKALDEVLGLIRPGMTEKDVAAELIYRMYRHGAEGISFDPIVVGGARGSMPHGVPGDFPIEKGTFLTMDFGCVLEGYCSDMTRTVAIGQPTDEMRKVYYTVLEAQLAGIAYARAGVMGRDIHLAGQRVIENAGYGQYFGHGFGHGLGIEIHESPTAAPAFEGTVEENAVISAEPGIYIPGRFGVRIEDIIVVKKDGCYNITKAPKELLVIG